MTPLTLSDEQCWQAVCARDNHYDGQFVTAVRTTGIFCRPSCTARQPLRQNVHFYPDAQAAQAAGFRPCKRCNPESVAYEAAITAQACHYIEAHLDERLTLNAISAAVGLSAAHLQRLFKRATGLSPREYCQTKRVEQFKARLRADESVTDAVYQAGFGSSSRVYESAGEYLGMPPNLLRKGGRGLSIRYALADCPLGRILVASSPHGLCAVSLGDADADLIEALRHDYPAADIAADEGGLAETLMVILAHLNGERPHVDLPLDVQATAFQRRVWDALRAIPYGETRSYRQVAEALGNPQAVRAVARACASNRVAVVIPCHRVIGSDGSLTGYRWGTERKAALLQRERGEA